MTTAERALAINNISEDLNKLNKEVEENSNELTNEDENKPKVFKVRKFQGVPPLTKEQKNEILEKASLHK